MTLDPETLKRPVCAGVPILMADGQSWLVRRPRPLWTYDEVDDAGLTFDLGPEYDAAWKAFSLSEGVDTIRTQFRLFRLLIVANYDLDADGLKQLLRLDFSATPEGEEPSDGSRLLDELTDVLLNRDGPGKPSPTGSNSPGS